VPGSLKPEQQIDVSKDTQTGNTPPKVQIASNLAGTVGQPVTLTATVTDDGSILTTTNLFAFLPGDPDVEAAG